MGMKVIPKSFQMGFFCSKKYKRASWRRRMAFSEIRKPFNLWSISVQYVAVPWGGGGHAPLWGKMCQYLINTWLNPPTIPYVLGGTQMWSASNQNSRSWKNGAKKRVLFNVFFISHKSRVVGVLVFKELWALKMM